MQYIQEAYLIQLNKLGDLLRLHNTDPVSGTHGHFVAAVIIGFHGLAFALSATGNLYNDLIFRGQDNASLVQAVGADRCQGDQFLPWAPPAARPPTDYIPWILSV